MTTEYIHIDLKVNDHIAQISFNCVDNINEMSLMDDLDRACREIAQRSDVKVLILSPTLTLPRKQGRELNEDLAQRKQGRELNEDLAQRNSLTSLNTDKSQLLDLSRCFHTLSTLPQPLLGVIDGHASGDLLAILACCDIVIAADNAQFSLSDTDFNLNPAIITPYLIRKIGYSHCRALFISSELFDVQHAKLIGLVHHTATSDQLQQQVDSIAAKLKDKTTLSTAETKQLLDQFYPVDENMMNFTAELQSQINTNKKGS